MKNQKFTITFLMIISIWFLSFLVLSFTVFNDSSPDTKSSSLKLASPQSEAFTLDYHLVAGGIGFDDRLEGMVLDQDGNIILYGCVAGNIGFFRHNPSLSTTYVPLNSTSSTVSGNGVPSAISLDSLGNIYLAGYSFGEGPEQYLIKYSNSLAFQWNKTWGNGAPSYDMIIDSNNNIFVAGDNSGGISHGDLIMIKYDPNGNELWNITSPERWPVFIFDYRVLAKDSNDNIYLVYDQYTYGIEGYIDGPVFRILKFSNSGTLLLNYTYIPLNYEENVMTLRMVTLDNSDNLYILGRCFSKDDIYLIKYDNMGVLQWEQSYDFYGSNNVPREIAFDSIGNLYLLGEGDYVALAKIDPTTGNMIWETPHTAMNERAYSITFDSSNNIYIAGKTLDPSDNDMLLIKYSSGGQLLAKNAFDFQGNETGLSIVINANNDVFIAGDADSFFASNDYDFLLLKLKTSSITRGVPFGHYHLLYLCFAGFFLVIIIRKKSTRSINNTLEEKSKNEE